MEKNKYRYVDIEVGKRIRHFRQLKNVSQEKLANACGLSFQQIQKYEKGSNRVSASRLYEIAAVLNVNTAAFFDGIGVCNDNTPSLSRKQKKAAEIAERLTDHQFKAWVGVADLVQPKDQEQGGENDGAA